MQTSILWRSIVLGSCLIGLTACGGGGDDGGAANPPSNPGDPIVDPGDGLGANSTIPATAQRPAYSVNVLEDAQGDSALTINSSLGDAAYLIFKGNKPGVGQLVGGLYQAPDGQVARLTFKQDGSGRLEKLETDAATIRYTDYSSNSVTVTVEYPDGSRQRFPNQPIDPALQQRLAVQALDID
ncbi:MAG: hypothetical protein LPK85_02660, partial [Gammaproteobacteria bacterium]|nr:hypothetical protein [Gammaproteobacteria bacterium]